MQQDLLSQVQAAIDSALPASPERAAIDAAFASVPASMRATINAALAKVCTSTAPAPPAPTGMSTAGVAGVGVAAAAVGLAAGYALRGAKRGGR